MAIIKIIIDKVHVVHRLCPILPCLSLPCLALRIRQEYVIDESAHTFNDTENNTPVTG